MSHLLWMTGKLKNSCKYFATPSIERLNPIFFPLNLDWSQLLNSTIQCSKTNSPKLLRQSDKQLWGTHSLNLVTTVLETGGSCEETFMGKGTQVPRWQISSEFTVHSQPQLATEWVNLQPSLLLYEAEVSCSCHFLLELKIDEQNKW